MEEYCDCESSDTRCYVDDDDDDDDDNHDALAEGDEDPISKTTNSKRLSCKVIRKESLLAAQKYDLERVMDLLFLREHHARTLLIHYRWNVDKIFTVFVEKGKERLYAKLDLPAKETTTMDCGHCFCNECWTHYFIIKINGGQSRRIACMAGSCYSICDEGKIRNLVSARDSEMAEKFDRFLLESYIEDNKKVKWCPSVPHCGNAVRVDGDENCDVECACGQQFCFNCSYEPHSPCSCRMWEHWVRKGVKESKAVEWIIDNTKSCPRCHKPVQKNGGCNIVRCICGQPCCWLCGGPIGLDHTLHSIAGHDCGRYKEKHALQTQPSRNQYTHYYSRYRAHKESLEAEEKSQQYIAALESRNLKNDHLCWLSNGFLRLVRSRKFLLYSYPFAYYMFGEELFEHQLSSKEKAIKRNLFEDHQQQLEANIEKLSMLLEDAFAKYTDDEVTEENIVKLSMLLEDAFAEYTDDEVPEEKIKVIATDDEVPEEKIKVIPLSAVTDKYCEKLFEYIDNELLSPHLQVTHVIVPYNSKGAEKASRWVIDDEGTKLLSTPLLLRDREVKYIN